MAWLSQPKTGAVDEVRAKMPVPGLVPSRPTKPTAHRIVDKLPSDTVAPDRPILPPGLIHIGPQPGTNPVNKPHSFFHLHLISDATGETLLAAGRAASAQYK